MFWRGVRAALLTLAAIVLALEEWGWRPLVAWAARMAQWPPLARLEQRLQAAPPRWAVFAFLAPAVLLFPIKLLALWFIHRGHALLGIVVIVAAKLLGTALVGRIFVVTESQLMQLPWFAKALGWWRETKAKVKAAVRESAAWRSLRARGLAVRRVLKRWRRALG